VIDHGQFNVSINQELIPASFTSNDENEDIQIYRIKVTRTVVCHHTVCNVWKQS
jgi:hypothetical protein